MKKLITVILITLMILTGCTKSSKMMLDTSEIVSKFEKGESFVLYVTSATCPACQIYDEVYDDVSSEYKGVMYKVDYQVQVAANEANFTKLVSDYLGFIDATPTTLFVVEGEVVDRFVGIMKSSDLENSIINYKIDK